MTKPKAMQAAITAAQYAQQDPPVPYSQLDCYKFVRQCLRDNGGDMKYSGCNDLFRNGVKNLMPLSDAINRGLLKAGWVLFIHALNGNEPPQYQGDGKGNAYHMGLYTDMHITLEDGGKLYMEVVHSSQSRGGVYPSTLSNAWNYAAELVDVDYSDWAEGAPSTPDLTPRANEAVVLIDGLRLRKSMDTSSKQNVIAALKAGDRLMSITTGHADSRGNEWVYGWTEDRKHVGYARVGEGGKQYLDVHVNRGVEDIFAEPGDGDADIGMPTSGNARAAILTVSGYRGDALDSEQAMNLADELLTAGYSVRLAHEGVE